jgi:outer membrane protein OmpA-like peptidoglycan-associated protein
MKIQHLILSLCLISAPAYAIDMAKNSDEACQQANALIDKINQVDTTAPDAQQQLIALFEESSQLCPKNAFINATYADYLASQQQFSAATDRYKQAIQYQNIANASAEQQFAWQLGLLNAYIRSGKRFDASKTLSNLQAQLNDYTPPDNLNQQLKTLDTQLSEDLVNNPITNEELAGELLAFNTSKQRSLNVAAPKLLYRITFDENKTTPTATSLATLFTIAKMFNNVSLNQLRVIGHTDATGNPQYNQKLSKRRAQTVANTIISKYPALRSKIEVVGKGASEPLYKDNSPESTQLNRRVEFVFGQ